MTKTTTDTIVPDAALHADIERVAALWRESLLYDLKPSSAHHRPAQVQRDRLCDRACELEREIAHRPVLTVAGYAAKVAFINSVGFDAEGLIEVAFQLGSEAVALGIMDPPRLRTAAA